MGTSSVHQALRALTRRLEEAHIPYALVGALALGEHGYRRATVDIDILLTREGLARFREAWLGRGYVERFAGSRGLRDSEHGVPIDVLLAGEFPGDGHPKDVRFPDPATAIGAPGMLRVLPLEQLLELKLASGLSAPHRLRDLADVLEVIRARALPAELASSLAPSVRAKYVELWQAAQAAPRDDA
jgi:hypothetical protein